MDETKKLGKIIGSAVSAGTVLALTGDLGSGKTSFVQGLAEGLEVPDDYYITSPSYTLINEYPGRFFLYHVDLYRITDSIDIEDIGLYEIFDDDAVVAHQVGILVVGKNGAGKQQYRVQPVNRAKLAQERA